MGHSDQLTHQARESRLKDYLMLTKPSLSIMVVFSSVVSFLMVPNLAARFESPWAMCVLVFLGGFLVTGSANAINQAVEKDTDAMMKRTASRPVASGRMKPEEAWAFAIITGAAGLFILGYFFNMLSAVLAAVSLFLYAFVYTPLKKQSAVAVFVGAFPGALPCLIGWAAGNNAVFERGNGWQDYGGWVLFGLQFLWQFPHFWAIAWIAHRDYSGAGFKLLPTETGPTKMTAMQAIVYALMLIPVSALMYTINLTGLYGIAVVMIANFFLIWQCIRLYREMDAKAARRVMFGSYIYLPVVLLAMLADKIG